MSLRNRRHPAVGTATTRWLSYLQTGNPPANPFEGASDIGLMGETPPWYGDPSDPDPDQPDPELDAEPDEDFPPPDAEPLFADLALPYPLYERTVQGWAHLGAVRCAGTAAVSATPIPCGAEYHDPAARSFRALYESAREAGWRPDVFGRWHCRPCAHYSGEYRTPAPVVHYSYGIPDARLARDDRAVFWLGAMAEHDLIRDVADAARRGRHHAGTVTR